MLQIIHERRHTWFTNKNNPIQLVLIFNEDDSYRPEIKFYKIPSFTKVRFVDKNLGKVI